MDIRRQWPSSASQLESSLPSWATAAFAAAYPPTNLPFSLVESNYTRQDPPAREGETPGNRDGGKRLRVRRRDRADEQRRRGEEAKWTDKEDERCEAEGRRRRDGEERGEAERCQATGAILEGCSH